jgi:hypothetical protein
MEDYRNNNGSYKCLECVQWWVQVVHTYVRSSRAVLHPACNNDQQSGLQLTIRICYVHHSTYCKQFQLPVLQLHWLIHKTKLSYDWQPSALTLCTSSRRDLSLKTRCTVFPRVDLPTTELTERASRRPSSFCLAVPAFPASLGSVTDTLNCNWDCAYANEFPVAVEDPDVLSKLPTKT